MGNRMSFSVTLAEETRVKVFLMKGYVLDPRQAADLIMVIVIASAYFIQFIAVLFMMWNRGYPPIKAKSPVLMMLVFVASVLWFAGDLQVNGHAPLKGTALVHCKAVGIWMHILMGVCAVSSLIGLRSYGLYRVFCRGRPYRGLSLYISTTGAVAVMLAYGIVTQALPGRVSVYYSEIVDLCNYTYAYRGSMFTLVWITWVIVAALNWRIRKIKSSFNESREITIACVVVFAVLIFMTIMSYTKPSFPASVKLRVLATSLNHFAASTVWWLIMAVPLYKCLTNRDAYLKQWVRKLRRDGLQRAYHIETGTTKGSEGAPSCTQKMHSSVAENCKGAGYADANSTFYYAAHDNGDSDKPEFCGSPRSHISGNVATYHNSSVSSLVQYAQSPPLDLSGCSSSPPPSVLLPLATKCPWTKLTKSLNVNSPNAAPPEPSPPTAPLADKQPYTPYISFPEPAITAPLRFGVAVNSPIEDCNKRQLL